MKVAIVHDYIKEYGGAERVLEALHKIWPESTVFTSVYLPKYLGPHKESFADWDIRTSSFQNIPFATKLISPMRLFSRKIFGSFDLSGFDLIIVSATGAYLPNFINPTSLKLRGASQKALHICYCHTPPRYLYGYPTARNWKKTLIGRIAGEYINHDMRLWDFEAAQKVDYFIANSNETKRRIEKFYRRDAKVIYPPTGTPMSIGELKAGRPLGAKKEYYLAGGRLARAKHIELIIEAFNKLGLKLKIFGKAFAGYEKELKDKAGGNIEFLGEIEDIALLELYREAKALVFAAEYEDFGIMPVEAQSQGTGVIAFRSGGVIESVVENVTGIFFDELTTDSLINAVKRYEKLNIRREDCIKNSLKFTKARFKKEIIKFVTTRLR